MNFVVKRENDDIEHCQETLFNGLAAVIKENDQRPLTVSGAFLCYRMRIDPVIASEHLDVIISKAVERHNNSDSGYLITTKADGSDILLTIDKA